MNRLATACRSLRHRLILPLFGLLLASTAQASVITFATATASGGAVSGTEDGFDYSTYSGKLDLLSNTGAPGQRLDRRRRHAGRHAGGWRHFHGQRLQRGRVARQR